jgi:ABC-type transport system involved in multi-copper enzyme maturation permease subunit
VTRSIVLRLMMKDWYLSRTLLAVVGVLGAVSIASLYLRHGLISLVGMVVSLFATMFLGILMPSETIINERMRQNLPFVMSLPVSPMQYTTAKILANWVAFLALWLPIAAGMIGTVAGTQIYGGIIPIMLLAAFTPFTTFALFVAAAIVTESHARAMGTMIASTAGYSVAWTVIARDPGFWQDVRSPVAIWNPTMISILSIEIGTIVVALALTFYLQSRKTDFV